MRVLTRANGDMGYDQKMMGSGPVLATDFPAQPVAQQDHTRCNPSSRSKGWVMDHYPEQKNPPE